MVCLQCTGFYYFIFTNDNEITNNFVAASFDMRKTVFDVTSRSQVITLGVVLKKLLLKIVKVLNDIALLLNLSQRHHLLVVTFI